MRISLLGRWTFENFFTDADPPRGQTRPGLLRPGIPASQPFPAVFARDRSRRGGNYTPGMGPGNSASRRKQRQQAERRLSSRPMEAGQRSARRRWPDAVNSEPAGENSASRREEGFHRGRWKPVNGPREGGGLMRSSLRPRTHKISDISPTGNGILNR